MSLNNQTAVQILYKMLKSRLFEQEAYRIKEKGFIKAPLFLSIGQEASAAAVLALSPDDIIFAPYRNIHIMIASDVNAEKMFREMLASPDGLCAGRSGCFGSADNSVNFYGSSVFPSNQFGKAVGAALSLKLQKRNNCVLCFGGDGASADGLFYEALNAASINKLAIVFFIENNCFAKQIRTQRMHNTADISQKAGGFDISGIIVDGNDPVQIYEAVAQAAEYAKTNQAPVIVESKTCRLSGYTTDDDQLYRTPEEIEEWAGYDSIENLSEYLVRSGIGIADDLMIMRDKIENEIKELADKLIGECEEKKSVKTSEPTEEER